jgi:hypothetical protein
MKIGEWPQNAYLLRRHRPQVAKTAKYDCHCETKIFHERVNRRILRIGHFIFENDDWIQLWQRACMTSRDFAISADIIELPETYYHGANLRRSLRLACMRQRRFQCSPPCAMQKIRAFRWRVAKHDRICRTPFFIATCFKSWKFYRVGFIEQKCWKPLQCKVHWRTSGETGEYGTLCTFIRCPASIEHWLLARALVSRACENSEEVYLFGELFCAKSPFNFAKLPRTIWQVVLSMVLCADEIVSKEWSDAKASETAGFLEMLP